MDDEAERRDAQEDEFGHGKSGEEFPTGSRTRRSGREDPGGEGRLEAEAKAAAAA